MPRQCILTAAERSALLAFPTEKSELIRLFTFSEQDLSVIKQCRGDVNRLGFAVLLCALRYPGHALSAGERPPDSFLTMVARQLGIDDKVWVQYAEREETRREHLSELRAFLGLTPFGLRQFHQFARWLAELAMQTDKGVVLATALVEELRREKVVCLRSMWSNEFARWRSRARIAGST
jgi:TnpA family transposase